MSRTLFFVSLACLAFAACDDDDDSTPTLVDASEDSTVTNDSGPHTPDSEVKPQPEYTCDTAVNYGWRAAPSDLISGAAYQPKAVWTNTELAAQWVTPETETAPKSLWFGRFDREGTPLSTPIRVGNVDAPVHDLIFTGTQYISVWRSEVLADEGYDGLRVQIIDAQGQLSGDPFNVPLTFDVSGVAAAFTVGGTGMLAYDRGVNGVNGIHVRPISEDGHVGDVTKLTTNASMSPAITYGDGMFGIAWLDRTTPTPMGITFAAVNSDGTIRTEPTLIAENAAGSLHIAYSNSTFAIGMSRSTSDGLLPFLALVSGAGNTQSLAALSETKGYILVTDVSWLNPDSFGVAWQEKTSEHTSVGLTRVGTSGQIRSTLSFPIGDSALQGLTIAGNTTRTLAVYTDDPASTGSGFSDQSHAKLAIFGSCE